MFRIEQLKLPITYSEADLKQMICKELKLSEHEILSYQIIRRSLDARKKSDIHYSFVFLSISLLKNKIFYSNIYINVCLSYINFCRNLSICKLEI